MTGFTEQLRYERIGRLLEKTSILCSLCTSKSSVLCSFASEFSCSWPQSCHTSYSSHLRLHSSQDQTLQPRDRRFAERINCHWLYQSDPYNDVRRDGRFGDRRQDHSSCLGNRLAVGEMYFVIHIILHSRQIVNLETFDGTKYKNQLRQIFGSSSRQTNHWRSACLRNNLWIIRLASVWHLWIRNHHLNLNGWKRNQVIRFNSE